MNTLLINVLQETLHSARNTAQTFNAQFLFVMHNMGQEISMNEAM
jgi:hypothetical protein